MGPRAGLEAVAKRKISLPCTCLETNPSCPARNLTNVLTELPWLYFKACNYMYIRCIFYMDLMKM